MFFNIYFLFLWDFLSRYLRAGDLKVKFIQNVMIRFFKIAAFTVLLSFFSSSLFAQGYEIKVKIPALKDSSIILGHYFTSTTYAFPDDTAKVGKNGWAVFKKPKTLQQGIYFIYLPTKSTFDIIIGANQHFTIMADTGNHFKTTSFVGSPDNQLFYEYRNLVIDKSAEANKLVERKKTSKSEQQKDSITKAIDKINQEVMGFIKKNSREVPGMFFPTFLKSMQEIEVPDFPRDAQGKVLDSLFQYKYYYSHYFDNFDYTDTRLVYTPIYDQKIKTYIEKAIPQVPDSIIKYVDMLLARTKPHPELFRYMLVTLYNHYAQGQIMGMENVAWFIADKYYIPYATWASKEFIDNMKKDVEKKRNNLLFMKAANIDLVRITTDHFMVAKTDTALKSNPYIGENFKLHSVKSKFTILVFWESDCGHCKKIVPNLYDSVYPLIKRYDAQVIAVHTISSVEGKRKMIDFINDHHMYEWINAWSPYSNAFRDLYDVYSTPVIYVLDENKTIIAKRIGTEHLEGLLKFETEKKNKK